MNLGENIYRLRTEKNLSQGDLADALEVSRQSVSKWENNSAVPELEKLIKMAQIFDITIDELVTGEAKEEPAAPTPLPQPAPAQAAPMAPGKRLVTAGIVLLCFGVFFSLLSLLLGLPFLVCGVLCLTLKRRHGLWCCWTIYISIAFWLFTSTTFSMGPFWSYLQALIISGTSRVHPATILIAIANNAVTVLMTVWTIRSYKRTARPQKYSLRFFVIGWSLTFLPSILQQIAAALSVLTFDATALIHDYSLWRIVLFLLQWIQLAGRIVMLFHTTKALDRP